MKMKAETELMHLQSKELPKIASKLPMVAKGEGMAQTLLSSQEEATLLSP